MKILQVKLAGSFILGLFRYGRWGFVTLFDFLVIEVLLIGMRKINTKINTLLVLLFLASVHFSYSQKELAGIWEVFCPMERTEDGSLNFCNLCENVKYNQANSGTVVYGFEMKIEENKMEIRNSESVQVTNFKWDVKARTMEFGYKQQLYKFKLLNCASETNFILKDKDCHLLTLTKK